MRKHIALGSVLALGLGSQAIAAEGFSYNTVEAAYVDSELDGGEGLNISGDGFALSGSAEFGANFFGFADYDSIDFSGATLSLFSLGAGFHWELNPSLDFVSGLSYERLKLESLSSESGFGLNVGLRGRIGESFELNGGVKYVDFGSGADDMVFSAGGRYYFTPAFAAGIDISKYDDLDMTSWAIVLRYDFGG